MGKKSKRMEKMSVLEEFMGTPDDTYLTPDIPQESLDRIAQSTAMADMPIEVKIRNSTSEEPKGSHQKTKGYDQTIGPGLETILKQLSNNSKTEPKTILKQLSNNSKTEPKTILKQLSNKPETETSPFSNNSKTEPKTILKQLSNNSKTEPKTSLGVASIVGLQRKILDYLFLKAHNSGSLNTGKIYTEVLAEMLACSVETVRTSIQRLEKKHLIIRKEFKSGRGGFSVYDLEKLVYQNLIFESNSKTILKQLSNNSKTEPKTEPKTKDPNSSSSSNIKDTTTIQIPECLKNMISQKEILDLLGKGLVTEEDLSQSLEHFAYDFSNNLVKARSNPVSLFFGLSRSGKTYRSFALIEIENQDLRNYEKRIQAVETENQRLKSLELKDKYNKFKTENPDFIAKIREKNQFIQDDDVADKIGFSRFSESQKEAGE